MARLCRKPQVCPAAYYQWQEERGTACARLRRRLRGEGGVLILSVDDGSVDDGSSYELSAWRRAALPRRFALAAALTALLLGAACLVSTHVCPIVIKNVAETGPFVGGRVWHVSCVLQSARREEPHRWADSRERPE